MFVLAIILAWLSGFLAMGALSCFLSGAMKHETIMLTFAAIICFVQALAEALR